jgi:hypothetical protein
MILCLLWIPISAFAAVTVTTAIKLDAINLKVQGEAVAIHGTSTLTSVNVQVIKPDGSILYFNVRSVVNGEYSAQFTLPANAPMGIYQIVAGQNTTVALQSMNVIASTLYASINSNGDDQVSIEEILPFIMNAGASKDLNFDGVFDRNDMLILLNLIKPISS